MRATIVFMLAGLLLALPLRGARAESPYRPYRVAEGGVIAGTVRIAGGGAAAETMLMTKDAAVCGSQKPTPRLRTGRSGGVADAVVYLETIAAGKAMPLPQRLVLTQRRCEYIPHVLLAPLGAELEIVNDDPILHNVHAYALGAPPRSVFNIAQPVKGQRTVVKSKQLSEPGFLSASCDAGHPWMGATIAIAPHPYYALTDTSGAFRLDDVPPGTYTLVVWHEGVRIERREIESEKVRQYVFEEPYVLKKEVVIPPKGTAQADFTLTLR